MANPRQRRKARSSSHKPVSHSRRAKKLLKKTPPIRGPKLLQDAWDKHKTVRQNYEALGLVHTLNPLASGGVEYDATKSSSLPNTTSTYEPSHSSEAGPSASSTPPIPKGYGRIIRDTDGNVVRVELGTNDEQNAVESSDEHDVPGLDDPELDKQVITNWVTELGGGRGTGAAIVHSLEQLPHKSSKSGPRYTSSMETQYLTRLVRRHGEDVESMARDARLNPEQRTVGELRRGIRRAGGARLGRC